MSPALLTEGTTEDFIASSVHNYMSGKDILWLKRKAGEIVLGPRVKTYTPRECSFQLFSTIDSAYGVPMLLGVLEVSEDYRFIKPGECIILGTGENSKRLFGLLDKLLIGSGLGSDPTSGTYVVVLCSIGVLNHD